MGVFSVFAGVGVVMAVFVVIVLLVSFCSDGCVCCDTAAGCHLPLFVRKKISDAFTPL